MTRRSRFASDSFRLYLGEIGNRRLLTAEEEQTLARAHANGDTHAGHELITANLRFVVKIANEFRSYGFGVSDLVQEGNIGLMKALQKFDVDRGVRFVSYAAWWIRAHIQSYILRSFSLVKLGTTVAQRKLFFALARTKRELDRMSAEHGADSDGEDVEKIASMLSVKPREVEEMSTRMGRDLSLDAPVGDDTGSTHVDWLAEDRPLQDEGLSAAQLQGVLHDAVGSALGGLDARERFIIEQRVMSDDPMTLGEVGERFSFSRERGRQLELRAKSKLENALQEVAVDFGWLTEGTAVETDVAAA